MKTPSKHSKTTLTNMTLTEAKNTFPKVTIRHRRIYTAEGTNQEYSLTKGEFKRIPCVFRNYMNLAPNGGQTEVIVEHNGSTIVSKSVCSKRDPFCRKTGVSVALKRLEESFSEPSARKGIIEPALFH